MPAKTLKDKAKPAAKPAAAPAKKGAQPTELPPAKQAAGKANKVANQVTAAPVDPDPAPEPDTGGGDGGGSTPPKRRATAEQMATRQREISVSEFFTKNRHLLGFDSPSKALLTAVKEAVDNSLDACEEAGILPEILVEIREITPERYVMAVEDNGPGIVKAQVPKIFGKLLYGSKFHRLKQSRGQQGIGISAAAMYGQLTTGKPITVVSKTGKGRPAHLFEIQIDTRKNMPVVVRDEEREFPHDHGTRVEIEMEADYRNGKRWLARYLEQTALANPHCKLTYKRPDEGDIAFPRAAEVPPTEALEIKPHPHGVELGQLMLKLKETTHKDLKSCLMNEFSRVTPAVVGDILKALKYNGHERPHRIADDVVLAEKLHKVIQATKIMAPPTNCLSPIGEELIHKGLMNFLDVTQETALHEELEFLAQQAESGRGKKKEEAKQRLEALKAKQQDAQAKPDEPKAEGEEVIKGYKFFITSVTRPPKVYRGNPFQVEVGLAYGGPLAGDRPIELYRFANRVPLLFQRGACGVTEAIAKTDWRNYELSQPKNSLPVGPMILFVHIASVWVPFTSESKEAVAHYPEILAEIKLAAQECGRRLAAFVRKSKNAEYELQRRSIFELYIHEIAQSMKGLIDVDPEKVKKDFGKLANQFTGGEETDEILTKAAEKLTKRPRATDAELAEVG
jgi:DNA topoisomerase-6 subunit B